MSDTDDPILPDFFAFDGGATGAELAATDWSGHILGSPDHWPVQLRSMLATILCSPEAMFLAWGPDLVFFFNDAYRPLLGARDRSGRAALCRPLVRRMAGPPANR